VRVHCTLRRNQNSALAVALAEALAIAVLVQDEIVFRDAAVGKGAAAEGTVEAVSMPVVVTKCDRIAGGRAVATGAGALRDFGDVPQSARGTVLPNNNGVPKRDKNLARFLHWPQLFEGAAADIGASVGSEKGKQ
jgi:hypothetical protein